MYFLKEIGALSSSMHMVFKQIIRLANDMADLLAKYGMDRVEPVCLHLTSSIVFFSFFFLLCEVWYKAFVPLLFFFGLCSIVLPFFF